MRAYKFVTETRREFIREKRRTLKKVKKAVEELRLGCALYKAFDDTAAFQHAVYRMLDEIEKIDQITKPLA